jgi:hypothetical protein
LVIKQHLAQLDLEEEKLRQQFLHMDRSLPEYQTRPYS